MKKIIPLLTVAVLLTVPALAQVRQLPTDKNKAATEKTVKMNPGVQNVPVKSGTNPAPPPPPASQQAPAQTTTQPPAATPEPPSYYLVSAKVRVATGDDNKELPSGASYTLKKLSVIPTAWSNNDLKIGHGETLLFETRDIPATEYKPHSTNEIKLSGIYSFDFRALEILLGYVEVYGFKLIVKYSPNFPLDAWRLNTVTVVLEVKDRKGNPHPYLGYREIMFSPNKLMKAGDNTLELFIDKNFMRQL